MNYGLDISKEISEQSEQDFVFGALALPDMAEMPEEVRESYLPSGEIQRGAEDMMDCASRGPINILEAKFHWLLRMLSPEDVAWLKEQGYMNKEGSIEFSDAAIAIWSDTTKQGNSLKAPIEAIRKNGLVPKSKLPLEQWMKWEDYHDPERITPELIALGSEFMSRFAINYEKVNVRDFPEMLKQDFLNVALYAWPEHNNGIYPRTEAPENHVCILYQRRYFAFDNYVDSFDGNFVKNLAPDYKFFNYGYRLTVNRKPAVPETRKGWFRRWLHIILS